MSSKKNLLVKINARVQQGKNRNNTKPNSQIPQDGATTLASAAAQKSDTTSAMTKHGHLCVKYVSLGANEPLALH